jgi:peroxiredoxin
MSAISSVAPVWQVAQWFNTPQPITLESLRGKVVVLEAFQMLCPGCVSHGLPQAMRVRATFPSDRVAVIGLHTVFEHHGAMTAVALQAFLSEYRITFPVGIDQPGERAPTPQTMQAYGMQGTPTLILIDAAGHRRAQHFGQIDDLRLGAEIASLLGEPVAAGTAPTERSGCDDDACPSTAA